MRRRSLEYNNTFGLLLHRHLTLVPQVPQSMGTWAFWQPLRTYTRGSFCVRAELIVAR